MILSAAVSPVNEDGRWVHSASTLPAAGPGFHREAPPRKGNDGRVAAVLG